MTTARAEFLGAGHYAPLADVAAELSHKYASAAGLIIEPGAGTGYYISRVLDRLPDKLGLAIDISKYAARRCARAHARLGAVVADVSDQLPLKDESASVILSVFAPRQPPELFRTLQRKGILIIAAPTGGHLDEIRVPLGLLNVDPLKDLRITQALGPYFRLLQEDLIDWNMQLDHRDLVSLVSMGPSARHMSNDELLDRATKLPTPLAVTASIKIRIYIPRQHGFS